MSDNAVMPIVRVAVLGDKKLAEVALPTQLPMRDIIPSVHRMLVPDAASSAVPQQLSLAPVHGAPFSADATLDTVGVVDGDLLLLRPTPAGPAAPGVVEDIADAAVLFSEARTRPWGPAHIVLAARIGVVALILVATVLAGAYGVRAALGAIAAAVALAALLVRRRAPKAGAELAVTALAPILAALALALPGAETPPRALLASAGAAAWSFIWLVAARGLVACCTATLTVALGVSGAAAGEALWRWSALTAGCAMIVAALLLTAKAAQLSALAARLPLPTIPAPGDPAPSAPAMAVLKDLPRRVRLSDSYQNGLVAGACLLAVLGSLAVVSGAAEPCPWAWYLVFAVGAGAALRARVWDAAVCKAWLLAVPFLSAVALIAAFASAGRCAAAWAAFAVFAVLVGCLVVVALNPKLGDAESYSLPSRRALGFVASAFDASVLPVAAQLVGLFALVLDR
jgi:type VII secretion integral membrane protein EccD